MAIPKEMSLEATRAADRDDPRAMRLISIAGTSIAVEGMIYRKTLGERTPLIILSPVEFPIPPSTDFCEKMWHAGYQVVFFRRPGFGRSPDLPAILMTKDAVKQRAGVAAEAAIFAQIFDQMNVRNYCLMGLGTANSVCYRLAQLSSEVQFSVYANPLFHPAIWDVIRPPWLRSMIRQTILSKSGLEIAVRGLKAVLRRDPIWFYEQFAQKSDGDLEYIRTNRDDFRRAGLLLQKLGPETYYYNLQIALIEDTRWNADYTRTLRATILSGVETTEVWKREITAEAERLGLPIVFAPSGDLFVPYASADALLKILEEHVQRAKMRS